MEATSEHGLVARILTDADMSEGELLPFARGEVALYSARSPEKQGKNEDAAALIEVVHQPCLRLTALLELRRLTAIWVSSLDSSEAKGEQNAGSQEKTKKSVRRGGHKSSSTTGRKAPAEGDTTAPALAAGAGKGHRDGGEQ